jgi:hypothetical protein
VPQAAVSIRTRLLSVDHQLEKRQRFDQFVESVPYQKLSGPVFSTIALP